MTRSRLLIALILALLLVSATHCGSSASDDGAASADVTGDGSEDGTGEDGTGLEKDTPSSDEEQAFVAVSVDTVLDPAAISAGDQTTVSCVASDAEGNQEIVAEADATIAATPDTGVTVDGLELSATVAGEVAVTCSAGDLSDDTPAVLTVSAAAAALVTTVLGEEEIQAGGSTTVTCLVEDEYGNTVEGASTTIDAPPEVTVGATGVTGEQAGDWELLCTLPSAPDIEALPATLTILPGEAVEFEVYLKPERDHYAVADKITVKGRGVDAYGNKTADIELVDVTAAPMATLEVATGDNKFIFLTEGSYTFTATDAGDAASTDDITVVVDSSGPAVVIDFPGRGLMLDDSIPVVATGSIADVTSEIASFTINEQPVTIQPDGAWSASIPPMHGQNHLVFEAEDAWGNQSITHRAFHYSTGYTPMNTPFPEDSMVHDAIVAFLGEKLFIDDDDPENQATLTKIASMILADMDLNGLLPNPATSFDFWPCTYDVYIEDIAFGDVNLQLRPVDGGLHLLLEISDFEIYFELDQTSGVLCILGVKGTALADKITLVADLYISLDGAKNPFVEMGQPTVDIENLTIDGDNFGGEVLGALLGLFQNLISGILQGVVEGILQDQVVSLLQDGLSALAMDMPIEFDLPLGAGIPVALQLVTAYDTMAFAPDGGTIALASTIRAEKKIDREGLGAIKRAGCLGQESGLGYQPMKDMPIEAAIFDDMLNQAFYSLWSNGLLHLNMSEQDFADMNLDLSQYGIANMALNTEALLPPVIESCDTEGKRLAQVGDLKLHTTFEMTGKPVDLTLYMYVQVEVGIGMLEVDGVKKIAINIPPFEVFEAEIVALNDEWEGKESVFENLIGGILKKVIEDQLAAANEEGSLAFEIPAFGLASLLEGLPPELGLTFEFNEFSYAKGYTVAKGAPAVVAVDPNDEGGGLGCSATAGGDPLDLAFLVLALAAMAILRRRAQA